MDCINGFSYIFVCYRRRLQVYVSMHAYIVRPHTKRALFYNQHKHVIEEKQEYIILYCDSFWQHYTLIAALAKSLARSDQT